MRRWLIALVVLLAMAGGGWLWGSPYLTLLHLKRAADARDLTAISERIDFPAVRADLKTQLRARLDRREGSALEQLGAAIAEQLADPALDAAVTPEGMRALFASAAVARAARPSLGGVNPEEMRVRRDALDRFTLASANGTGPELVFELQGLTWRVTAVRLPGRL
ncbi:hypothetical protein FHS95_000038 [Sphingomonas naasensis]|uniref:DUF2939 domain-containing protein n=1 Tax=Sphingomonas naasensis TaxID=1344951 RepID=A0A4S1WQK7_9SPHN|nr:DUF2939 domain-containing protein [Sphingomonas naasensis]NIJ18369.1 hypothetical protein [Sphingomonas naasensis]TGX45638.1 DUF2939 domain-containing protein [Sphingomonas naasensis]